MLIKKRMYTYVCNEITVTQAREQLADNNKIDCTTKKKIRFQHRLFISVIQKREKTGERICKKRTICKAVGKVFHHD